MHVHDDLERAEPAPRRRRPRARGPGVGATACTVALLVAAMPVVAQVAATETLRLAERRTAPWRPAGQPSAGWPEGVLLTLAPGALSGPAPLRCTGARHRFLRVPAEGLFEGMLPPPAAERAAALGLPPSGLTQRVTCANGGIDLHRAADGTAWTAVDHTVLRWAPVSVADSPEATVQSLLLRHLAGEASISAASLSALDPALTPSLSAALRRWLAEAARSDEVPALNGDPFTDSQETPQAFSIGPARVRGDQAEVAVRFDEGEAGRAWRVRYRLVRTEGRWRVADIVLRDGQRVSRLLAAS